LLSWLRNYIRGGLTRRRVASVGSDRKVRMVEEAPSDRFVLIIALMIVFFVGLLSLEIVHMVVMGSWNEIIFNGIMLIVGTIVGAVWGRQET
jgi:hypothetical protein